MSPAELDPNLSPSDVSAVVAATQSFVTAAGRNGEIAIAETTTSLDSKHELLWA